MTILLATTLLASGPMYSEAVYLAGAQRTLQDAEPADVSLLATTRARGPAYAAVDERVTPALTPLLAGGGEIARSGASESYALPGQETVSQLASFQFRDGLEQYTTLSAGSWPVESGVAGHVEAALPAAAAELLEIEVGDTLLMVNRVDQTEVTATVSGIFDIDNISDPYWHAETMAVEGVIEGSSFNTYGPFFVPREVFLDTFTTRPATLQWQAFPRYDMLAVDDLPHLRAEAGLAAGRANANRGAASEVTVTTRIPAIITDIERSLLATRSGVLILTIQLALLAAYALFLTAGILVDQRTVETALVRSRGAGVRQMLVLASFEGCLLVAPAVLLGPPLAALALRLLNRFGPLSGIGLTLRPELAQTSWLLALAAGAVCLLTLTLPATFSARSVLDARAARGRETGTSIWRRGGLDVIVLAIAGIGLLQLRRYGSPITETVQGSVDIDPLLVAAPALGLLAGAIIALRMIPWVGRLIERVTTSGSRLPLALGGWQIGRRPLRYSRSALLLTLALGIGLFAAAYTTTWRTSQDDQAGYQTGAGIRLQPSRRPSAISELHLTRAHTAIDGVTLSMPVDTYNVNLSRTLGSATLVLLDADLASDIVHFRDDLAASSFSELMDRLVTGRPDLVTMPLAGQPARVALDITADFPPPCPEEAAFDGPVQPPVTPPPDPPAPDACIDLSMFPDPRLYHPTVTLSIVLIDGNGNLHVLRGESLRDVNAPRRYVFLLAAGDGLAPQYPLQLAAVELSSNTPQFVRIEDAVTLHSIAVSDSLTGDDWTPVEPPDSWTLSASTMLSGQGSPPVAGIDEILDDGTISITIDLGHSYLSSSLPVYFSIAPEGSDSLAALPVIVNERLLEIAALEIGDRITVDFAGGERTLEVAGTLQAFPTLDPVAGLVVIADSETLGALQLSEPGIAPRVPRERWLSVSDSAASAAAETLSAAPFSSSRVQARVLRSQSLQADPVTLGMIGALSIGFVAAAIFAVAGFAISVTTTARERLTEFALLRAIGLSPRQLASSLMFENGVLVVVSLVAGATLGLLLSWLVLPLITVSRSAGAVFPAAIVIIPWGTIALLMASIVAVLAAASLLIVISLRRRGLGAALRIGED
ncbi:MAG TPA: ABC transporter permease [Thermomicrobiales bacterium]|nr:ABC transporter permease [Thermomicrobiales bacterium]